jgi:DNA-binding MarR family transcriptional regulator
MNSETKPSVDEAARADVVRDALRNVRVQLSVLNHHIGAGVDVRDTDFDCLDLISIYGPLTPSELARLAGLKPATLTGILDRLERGGWIARDRDAADRRAVRLRVLPDRNAEVLSLYAGMNTRLDGICADYDRAQLEMITGFLRRVHDAGAAATAALADGPRLG